MFHKSQDADGREYVAVREIVLPPSPVAGGVPVPLQGDPGGLPVAYVCKGVDPSKAGLERREQVAPLLEAFYREDGEADKEEAESVAERATKRLQALATLARIGFAAYGEDALEGEILPRMTIDATSFFLAAMQGASPDVRVAKTQAPAPTIMKPAAGAPSS